MLDILFFALIAAFLFFRLFSVLGSRTGEEKKRPNPFSKKTKKEEDENVVDFSQRRGREAKKNQSSKIVDVPFEVTEIGVKGGQKALDAIKKRDASFSVAHFLKGSETAFSMILKAFAAGDTKLLKRLLSSKVYDAFSADIEQRKKSGMTLDIDITSIHPEIVDAHLTKDNATINVRFESEQRHTTNTPENDEKSNQEAFLCTDIWTFERILNNPNPNWILINTQEEMTTEQEKI